jgi:zinc protease
LFLESDRLAYLLDIMTPAVVDAQRDVVKNERRQNYENRPYGLATMVLLGALYPPGHPYHWLTIGRPDDLRAASLDEVRGFFTRYYHPANASLALAGDIETDDALQQVSAFFGPLPAGPAVAPPAPGEPRPARDARLMFEDSVELPRLYLGWPSPAIFSAGDAELDLLAEVLAGGKSSRLYRSLVYDRRVATEVAAGQNSRELTGFFSIVATAAPGYGLSELERVIAGEVDRLTADGPEASELERSLTQAEAAFVYRLQTVGGFGGKADQLNSYQTFAGNPDFAERDWLRYRQATAGAIRQVAADRLGRGSRVAVSVVPRGRPELALEGSTQVMPS